MWCRATHLHLALYRDGVHIIHQPTASPPFEVDRGTLTFAGFPAGRAAYYALWGYGGVCMGIFMVRTMKRVIFQEARQYGECSSTLLAWWGRHETRRLCASVPSLAGAGALPLFLRDRTEPNRL